MRRGSRVDRRYECGDDHLASLALSWHTASHRDQPVSKSDPCVPFHGTHDVGLESAILRHRQKLHPGVDMRHRGWLLFSLLAYEEYNLSGRKVTIRSLLSKCLFVLGESVRSVSLGSTVKVAPRQPFL